MDPQRSRHEENVRALAGLKTLIATREKELREAEFLLVERVRRRDISLLNPIKNKIHVNFMALMSATLQLECKMARRCLFYLRSRERLLSEEIARYEERHRPAPNAGSPQESASPQAG